MSPCTSITDKVDYAVDYGFIIIVPVQRPCCLPIICDPIVTDEETSLACFRSPELLEASEFMVMLRSPRSASRHWPFPGQHLPRFIKGKSLILRSNNLSSFSYH